MEIVLCVEGMVIYMLYQLHSIKNASSSFFFSIEILIAAIVLSLDISFLSKGLFLNVSLYFEMDVIFPFINASLYV